MSVPTLTRRRMLRAVGAGALSAAVAPLAGCGGSDGRTTIRFLMNKPEVVDRFAQIVADFNAAQQAVRVVLDTTPASSSRRARRSRARGSPRSTAPTGPTGCGRSPRACSTTSRAARST